MTRKKAVTIAPLFFELFSRELNCIHGRPYYCVVLLVILQKIEQLILSFDVVKPTEIAVSYCFGYIPKLLEEAYFRT
jgi:hypothetical protein